MSKAFPGAIKIKNDPTFPDKDIIIHWARHAESCSNFKGANYVDENLLPDRPIGYKELIAPTEKKKKSVIERRIKTGVSLLSPNVSKNIFLYHPNLSFIGMQQAILLGSNFIRGDPTNSEPYNVVFVSPSLRTIMTALLAFRGTHQRIIVVPFIVEHLNIAGKFDNVNPPLALDKLKKYVAFVKDWLDENWVNNFDDIEIMTLLHTINSKIREIGELTSNFEVKNGESKIQLAWEQGWQNFLCWRETEPCSSKPIPADCQRNKEKACKDITDCEKDKKKTANCKTNPGNIQKPYFAISQLIYKIALTDYDALHKLSQHDLPPIKQLLKEIVNLRQDVLNAVNTGKQEYAKFRTYNPTEGSEAVKKTKAELNVLEENLKKAFNRLTEIMDDPTYFRGPPIDFTWVEEYWKKPDYTQINMKRFYTDILCKYLLEPDVMGETKIKIMCVSHGATMRDYFGKIYSKYPGQTENPTADLRNTQVYEETLRVSGNKISPGKGSRIPGTVTCTYEKKYEYELTYTPIKPMNYTRYKPKLIRSEYENFEIANIDVCQLRGLKGVLHYAIHDPKNEKKILSLKTNVSDILRRKGSTNLADYVTKDLRSYFNKPKHTSLYEDKVDIPIIKGGYYDKYMKYKYKYMQLKQQMNSTRTI